MSRQMSLFPTVDASAPALADGDGSALDDVFNAMQHFRGSREYLQLLRFIGRFPYYSAFNGFLLYIQNPDATYVATAGIWQKRFKRYLKPGARPLLILAPMSPVRFVFDLQDTEGEPFPPTMPMRSAAAGKLVETLFENTVHNCALHGIMVRQVGAGSPATGSAVPLSDGVGHPGAAPDLDGGMKYLILLYREHPAEDKYAAMIHELGQILCGHRGIDRWAWWPDRRKVQPAAARLEAASAAYLVCRRIGLEAIAKKYLADYLGQEQMLPNPGFNAILQATQYIEEMGRSRWQKPRKSR